MFRSTTLRLATLYTAVFCLAVVVLGVITLMTTRHALSKQFDRRISSESAALATEYRAEGLDGVVEGIRERDQTHGAVDYGLQAPSGEALAGRLAVNAAPVGWSVIRAGPKSEWVRVLTVVLPDGHRLLVGDEVDRVEALDGALLRGFAVALVGVLVLGIAGGYLLNHDVHRRLSAISGTAEAIIDGDLARRVPVRGSDDDLDRLALTFNRMLDRIAALMASLKQVSDDIAHDMRTPLTRLRQKLESGLAAPEGRANAMEGALEDLDSILDTFAGLLRIAQIEGGARRAAFRPCDLAEIGHTVVEAFAPSAEDAYQTLRLEGEASVPILGDPELLTQMLANLVENALRHAGGGAAIRVTAFRGEGAANLSVIDNGPGVPSQERERLFDRFYRLERSRSTPGSGLGLALVVAVARLHDAEVRLLSAEPGLEARVTFPAPA